MTATGTLFGHVGGAQHLSSLSLSSGTLFAPGDSLGHTTTDHAASSDASVSQISDSFVFSGGGGHDLSLDASAGDVLVIERGINGLNLASADDLASRIHSDAHGNAVLDLGHGDSVTLHGVSAEEVAHDPQQFVKVH